MIVGLHLGDEHPVTLAEEIVVLDNLSNGRIGVIGELGSLDTEAATEDVTLLRASWAGRPIRHRGLRWQVPAGLAGHVAPDAVMVTPAPAQLDVPLWVAGDAARPVGASLGLPVVAHAPGAVDAAVPVSPGRATLVGDVDIDRQTVSDWSSVGATHLPVRPGRYGHGGGDRSLVGAGSGDGRVPARRDRDAATGFLARPGRQPRRVLTRPP